MILYLAYPSFSTKLPIVKDLKKAPKLFFVDCGLINFRIGFKDFFTIDQSLNDIYRGKIAEQVVAQEIISSDFDLPDLAFWIREKAEAEIDFLYPFKNLVIPLEVKSGKLGKLKSLAIFMDKSIQRYAVRVYSGQTRVEKAKTISGKGFYLLSLPFYLLPRLEEMLEQLASQFK
jgi:hypothetical protein